MSIPLPSPSSISTSNSFPSAVHRISPPLSAGKSAAQFRLQTVSQNRTHSSTDSAAVASKEKPKENSNEQTLLLLLRQRKTEKAWAYYSELTQLPNSTCLSRLVSQLSYQNTPSGLARARSIVTRLRNERQLHRLDANSLGLLASVSAKSGHTLYASSIINSMLRSGYLPHIKAWSADVSSLSKESPAEAIKLFDLVMDRMRSFSDSDPAVIANSKPDTGAYNAVLNACVNLGDKSKFLKLFDEMRVSDCNPDALTYNIMIKMCARIGRKDKEEVVGKKKIGKKMKWGV